MSSTQAYWSRGCSYRQSINRSFNQLHRYHHISAFSNRIPQLTINQSHKQSNSQQIPFDFTAFAKQLASKSINQSNNQPFVFPFQQSQPINQASQQYPGLLQPIELQSILATGSVSNAARDDDSLDQSDDSNDAIDQSNDDDSIDQSDDAEFSDDVNNDEDGQHEDDESTHSNDRGALRELERRSNQTLAQRFADDIAAMRAIPYNGTESSTVPRLATLPLVPVTMRPGLPGSIFRWVLDPNNAYIRRVLERQIKLGHKYVGLFLYRQGELIPTDDYTVKKPTIEEYNAMVAADAENRKAKEHPLSDAELADVDAAVEASDSDTVDVSALESQLEQQISSTQTQQVTAGIPALSDYDEANKVFRFGVLAEFRLSGDTVSIMCHRRIEITGLAPSSHGANIITVNVKHHDELGPGATEAQLAPYRSDVAPTFFDHASKKNNQSSTTVQSTTAPASSESSETATPTAPAAVTPSPSTQGPYSHEIMVFMSVIKENLVELMKQPEIQKRATFFQTPHVDLSVPGHLCDHVASLLATEPHVLQSVLSIVNLRNRCYRVIQLVHNEKRIIAARAKINARVVVDAEHTSNYLREQKRSIEKQLGGRDNRQAILDKLNAKLEGKVIPAQVQRVLDEEMEKLAGADNDGTEFTTTRNYLDWLCSMPYSKYTDEIFDISRAESILEADHYAMDDVKQRILEFIATSKRAGREAQQGKILCLVGPPGTGKTSVAKSISKALGREFYRFSVGGMDDVAEIKGHRRTYMGAMPGKLIHALKLTEACNPVILIDEIDKIGRGNRGDPAAALLEVLDPEQNGAFVDHYMDVPIDLSHVLFVCTANDASTIPGPLADRMEFINISGYVGTEKVHIVNNYIEPNTRLNTGVRPHQLSITPAAVEDLVRWYCREPGMRNLQKYVERIYRKAALKIARDEEAYTYSSKVPLPIFYQPKHYTVDRNNLHEYAGKAVYTSDSMYETTPIGVAMGLAWTSKGGSLIFVESTVSDYDVQPEVVEPAKPKRKSKKSETPAEPMMNGDLFTTGQLGDVMKESVSIAYTVAKRQLAAIAPESNFFHSKRIHLHLPSGSTPKDGPSAGITIVCSLLSLALQQSLRPFTAMTGELSLTGKVLPVGGIKEKFLAARRSNVTRMILPAENRKDVNELQSFITEGVEICYVSSFEQVWSLVCQEHTSLQPIDSKSVTEAPRKRRAPSGRGKQRSTPVTEPVPDQPTDQPSVDVSKRSE